MKTGTKVGLFCVISGVLIGGYFSWLPLISATLNQSLSSHQVGIYAAVIGTILGLSCALMGVISQRF